MLELLTRVRDILRPQARRHLALAAVGSVVVAMLDGVGLVLVLPLVNLATGQKDPTGVVTRLSNLLGDPSTSHLVLILAGLVVVLFVLKDLGTLLFMWWLSGFVFAERARTSARVLSLMLHAPYSTISSRSSSEMLRTTDNAVLQVFTLCISGLIQVVAGGIAIAVLVGTLLFVSPLPTLALMIYFGVAAFLLLRIARPRAARAGIEMNEAFQQGYQAAFAALGAVKEVKLRGSQDHFVDSYRSALLRGARGSRTSGFLSVLPKYLLESLFIIAVGLVLALGAGGGSGGVVGLLALFVGAGFRLLPAVSQLLGAINAIRAGAASLLVVHAEVMPAVGAACAASAERNASTTAGIRSVLQVERLHFRYPGTDIDVLDDVSLEIAAGQSVALVGGSGAGKTTLVDVIVGLLEPTGGRIVVDGTDIAADVRAWQRSVAYVAQDVFLLDATLAENVAFDLAPEDVDRQRVVAALEQAQMTDVVDTLSHGIDTHVGERGTRLSGGQRQRIGIARALYRRCSVLVLDEATAALDNQTEYRVNRAIKDLHGTVTVVLIAHRLSTVKHCDQVVFLQAGKVQASGSFDELRRVDGAFARLVELGSLSDVSPKLSLEKQ